MERQFALPVALAAAAHAALLFGFSKPPAVVRASPIHRPVADEVIQIVKDEPVVATAAESSDRVRAVEPPPPSGRSPEPQLFEAGPLPTMAVPIWGAFDPGRIPNWEIVPDAFPHGGKAQWGDSVLPAALDNPPRTRFQAAPIYPFEAKKEGLRGEVMVEFMVNEEGRVVAPRVVTSTSPVFEDPTLRAVAKWVFEPGKRNGRVVRFRMSVPVVFSLND
jgi:periplasmic protein TonB